MTTTIKEKEEKKVIKELVSRLKLAYPDITKEVCWLRNDLVLRTESIVKREKNYLKWEKSFRKGIRNKTLINLMWLDSQLYDIYTLKKDLSPTELKEAKKNGNPPFKRYSSFLKGKDTLKYVIVILKCSERTARDYRDSLIYLNSIKGLRDRDIFLNIK